MHCKNLEEGTEAEAVEECCFTDLSQPAFLYHPGPPSQGWHPQQWPGSSHDTSTTKTMFQRLASKEIWGLHHISCPDYSDERNNKGEQKNPKISETPEGRRWAAQSHRQAVRELYSRRLKVAGPSYLEGRAKRFLKATIGKIRARIRHVRHYRNMKLGD